jgi:hypothetical protein
MAGFANRNHVWIAGIALLFAAVSTRAQGPCTAEQAQQWPGILTLDKAEQADNDKRHHGKPDLAVLNKINRAELLLKQAFPELKGVGGTYSHEIFDPGPHTDRFQITAPFFYYYCNPVSHNDPPGTGGKIRLNEETGTWIYIDFNTLGWLVNESNSLGKEMRTRKGETIFYLPRENGEWDGYRVFSPALHGEFSAAILFTPRGRFPFKPVSREEFLLAREAVAQKYLDQARAASGANSSSVKFREKELTDLQNYRASMPSAELQSEAIVLEWSGDPKRGRIFAPNAQHGQRLVTVDQTYIDRSLPRTAVQLIVLYWRWDEDTPVKREFSREFRRNFDVKALEKLLDR